MNDPYQAARLKMVQEQIAARGINDERLIAAMMKVPRHYFVPPHLQSRAYDDNALPIDADQTISQPYMVALMTYHLDLRGDEKVLEIGTGSGYQAALLAELAYRVYTIDRISKLAQKARSILEELGYDNIVVTSGDGTLGWSEYAPYDRIITTAAAPKIPNALFNQLKDGGKMVIPVGDRNSQTLKIIQRQGDEAKVLNSVACMFVPLVGKQGWNSE